jgi:predicted porin
MNAISKGAFALAALCAAPAALAQSSLTVFGVVDTTVQHIRGSDGASVTRMGSGGINGSRLGFKGSEDLGGGWGAGFHLEAGLQTDSGVGDATSADNLTRREGAFAFNRRSTVSLFAPLGELRLGRDYTPVADNHTDFDVFGNSGVGDSSLLTQSLAIGVGGGIGVRTDVRASNALVYVLPPDLGGVWGYAMVAKGEARDELPADFQRGDGGHQGLRIGYDNGTLNGALAWGRSTLAAQDDVENLHLGGTFKWGAAQFFGQLSRERTTVATVRHTNDAAALGLQYTLDAHVLKAQVVHSRIRREGDAAVAASMVALGYQYDLSKRTALEAVVSHIRNGADAAYDLGVGVGPGGSAGAVQMGIRHAF